MKMALTILAAAMLCAATGCEKKSDEPVRVSPFDPKLDGPPPVVEKVRAADLVADQRELARKVARVAPAPAPPGPSATQPAPSPSPAPATAPAAPAPATPEPSPAEPQAPPEET